MSENENPWIVTDEKMPCLIVAGKLDPPSRAQELKETLNSEGCHISNVYNCAAFALNRECTSLFCIKKDGRVAFVSLQRCHAIRDNQFFGEYAKEFEQAISKVRHAIDRMQNPPNLVLELVSIETSGRQPN